MPQITVTKFRQAPAFLSVASLRRVRSRWRRPARFDSLRIKLFLLDQRLREVFGRGSSRRSDWGAPAGGAVHGRTDLLERAAPSRETVERQPRSARAARQGPRRHLDLGLTAVEYKNMADVSPHRELIHSVYGVGYTFEWPAAT